MSKNNAPMVITLYNAEDEPIGTFQTSIIRWGIFKRAMQVGRKLIGKSPTDFTDEDIDELSGLIVAVFGDRFTVEELNNGADIVEMLAVLQAVIARARGIVPNAPPPG